VEGVFTAQQIREAEGRLMAQLPEGTLMRRAAYGLARHARRMLGRTAGRRVGLLVGAGDNGGDALWAGVELRRRGAGVAAVLLDPKRAHPAGLAAFLKAGGRTHDPDAAGLAALTGADLVLDGIVGLSGRGGLRDPAPSLVTALEKAGVPVLAVDLPSGVDTDTGTVDGAAVTATATVTFGARKPVHVLAAPRCGPVHVVDIGLGPYLPTPHAVVLTADDIAKRWPRPGPTDDKYSQGVAGVAAGSDAYPGAAILATGAAVLATSGMVRFAGSAAQSVLAHWPEVVTAPTVEAAGRTQAWAVGPGIGTDDAGREVLAAALAKNVPMVIDADGITLLAHHDELRAALSGRPAVLTPHAGEFARIAGEVGADRIAATRRAAAELGVTVLLKGNATVVADPDGRTLVHPSTGSWAATAGSGDVLTGITGALLAAGLEPWWAAGCAAFVHARAADIAADGVPTPASRLQASIPAALRSLVGTAAE
jgi:ADP-dependent NAD(P)H-hydrate dehydratase / NAD(P)H-hydrate epimerase